MENVRPPDTATGVELLFLMPVLPVLAPQQYATPAGVNPQVALSAENVRPPDTATGTGRRMVLDVPLPSPLPFSPQQYAAPPVVIPQA